MFCDTNCMFKVYQHINNWTYSFKLTFNMTAICVKTVKYGFMFIIYFMFYNFQFFISSFEVKCNSFSYPSPAVIHFPASDKIRHHLSNKFRWLLVCVVWSCLIYCTGGITAKHVRFLCLRHSWGWIWTVTNAARNILIYAFIKSSSLWMNINRKWLTLINVIFLSISRTSRYTDSVLPVKGFHYQDKMIVGPPHIHNGYPNNG